MIHTQMEKIVAAVPTAVGSSAVTLTVDALGYDQVSFVAVRAANAATTFASVLKVEQSNDDSTYVAVPASPAEPTSRSPRRRPARRLPTSWTSIPSRSGVT